VATCNRGRESIRNEGKEEERLWRGGRRRVRECEGREKRREGRREREGERGRDGSRCGW
jgi:hypothetical protein